MRNAMRATVLKGFMFPGLTRYFRVTDLTSTAPHTIVPAANVRTVTDSRGTPAVASSRTQSSFLKARRNDTGPSCRTNRCHLINPATHPNILLVHSDRSRSLINQPNCSSRFHPPQQRDDLLILQMMCHQRTHDNIHRLLRPIHQASPVTHAIPSSFGVDSAAARAA